MKMKKNHQKKLGRNEKCWCGSGKKYKRCHINREHENPDNPWDSEAILKKSFTKKECLAPDALKHECSTKIVSAHTVPIGSSLSYIEEEGHVLGYKLSFAALNKSGGIIRPVKLGLRQASTFFGFCSKHDTSLFSCVENQKFENLPEQCLAMAFRISAKEYYTKKAAQITPDLLASTDKGRDLDSQIALQKFRQEHALGLEAGMRDVKSTHLTLAKATSDGNFNQIQSLIFHFDDVLPVMFAGGFVPDFDLDGKPIQDLGDIAAHVQPMLVTAIGTTTGSAIVMSWLNSDDSIVLRYSKQIEDINKAELPSFLIQLASRSFENIYFKPSWYENLPSECQEHMTKLIMDGVNPLTKPASTEIISTIELNLPKIASVIRM